ncbi:VanZ family protein [Allobaculum sp. JKK-2023]|uniref:VanZ family protein n=1 Tax=Allobaculum sp. JKK-2023 TaxID=3108943 RepID=UPI002B053865|nr:VanZ family protein [Allobaculum sp. JKK-2023]
MKTPTYSASTNRKANLPLAFLYLLLLFILVCAIWLFSSQTGSDSQALSDRLIHLLHLESLPEIRFLIRKAAHFSVYLVMGILWYLFFDSLGFVAGKAVLGAVLFSLLFAGIDEIHQSFVADRACQFRDVILDEIGAINGTCLAYLLLFQLRTFRHRPHSHLTSKKPLDDYKSESSLQVGL